MKKLNEYFSKLKFSKFLLLGAILMYVSDILNILYLNLNFLPTKITTNYVFNIIRLQGMNPAQFDVNYINELRMVTINTISNVFYFFLVYHGFVYFLFWKNKKWAEKYVYGYALTGAILTLLELPFLAMRHMGWAAAMLFTTLVYIYIWFGLKFYKKQGLLKKTNK